MQNVALMPQRPPYVEFETRAEEDRTATIAAGHYIAKDVDYAIIRAIGAKDAVEREAVMWLEHIDSLAKRGDYPREWVKFFQEQYSDWKKGNDMKVNGRHVKTWPGISPAECAMLIAAKILTVQDVADANEETLQRLGMGARQLKQRAQAFLDTIQTTGSGEELASLRQKVVNQEQQIEDLNQKLAQLSAMIDDQSDTPKAKRRQTG